MSNPATAIGVSWSGVSVDLGGRTVVDCVDLEVAAGSWTTVVGPNGAGKTTLLRVLAGTVAHSGTVRVGSVRTSEPSGRSRARLLAVVPQHPVIPPGMQVFDYALLGRSPHQGLRFSASATDRRATAAVLDRLDLTPFSNRAVDSLSGGERQRVAIARSLINQPRLILCDEQTGHLDHPTANQISDLIFELHHQMNNILITVTHDTNLAAKFQNRLVAKPGHTCAYE